MRHILLIIPFIFTLFIDHTFAQFGVANKKNGGSFQELHELAKERMEGGNLADDLDSMDDDSLQKIIKDALNDPQVMNTMEQINSGIGSVIDELGNMNANDLKRHLTEGINQLFSPEVIDTIMGNKGEVLSSLKEQGLISAEQVEAYENDSSKFEEEMTEAITQMQSFFDSPETLQAATNVVEKFANIIQNPDEVLKKVAETYSDALNDNEKIEEARLQLLNDPGKTSDSILASLFENEEMKEILKDPMKWREQVRKGHSLLLQAKESSGSIGEL